MPARPATSGSAWRSGAGSWSRAGTGSRWRAAGPAVGETGLVTVLLTRSAIDGAVDVDRALRVLEEGFRAAPPMQAPSRIAAGLPGPGIATCLMPGTLPGIPA